MGGLIQQFYEQHIILSCEYNSVEPEITIYKKAIDSAHVKLQDILLNDDRKSLVDECTKHGMKAVIINDTEGLDSHGSGKYECSIIESSKYPILMPLGFGVTGYWRPGTDVLHPKRSFLAWMK